MPSVHAQPSPAVHLLDVPYLPQSEALCGGAAIAMIMRFWGATGVYAETFADLVDTEAQGIRGEDLLRALRARGFDAQSARGSAALAQAGLAERRPLVALIEDRPGRFHYVVIVGWTGGKVIVHDPARAPFRVFDEAAFERAWAASNSWTLVAAPGPSAERGAKAPSSNEADGSRVASPCGGMVDEGVRLAGASDFDGARRILDLASAACPADPAPRRERAGLHALRSEWADAAAEAREALARDRHDQHAARILATSLFLTGDDAAALDAWNMVGEPVIDLVDIRGLVYTRFAVAADLLDLPPQTLLSRARLARAQRRLDSLPSLVNARVRYEPSENGRTKVVAAVLERPRFPTGAVPLAAIGVRALANREARVAVASPIGGGELWTASWRWWEQRPRVAAGLAAPAPFGGVWSLEASTETQSYGGDGDRIRERRRAVELSAADWITGRLRWAATAAIERWPSGTAAAFAVGIDQRLADDRVSLAADASVRAGRVRTWTLRASADWRSKTAREGSVWLARSGVDFTGAGAPLALWSGAGTGHGRSRLLRAHSLLHDGEIRDGVFGRRLGYAGLEWQRWSIPRFRAIRFAPAAFVDFAGARRTAAFSDRRTHVDMGLGLRVALPAAGVLRIDLARGLRDGVMALSVGVEGF